MWSKRSNLKASKYWLHEDFSKETEEVRSKFYPYVKAARLENKKCSIIVDKLILDGKMYTIDKIDQVPLKPSPRTNATKTTEDIVLFYGKASPLSNFYPAKITVATKEYNCSEQCYQHSKAEFFGDDVTSKKIKAEKDPVEQMKLGRNVRGFDKDRWATVEHKIMFQVNMAKFSQNLELKTYLKNTGDKRLAEANPHDKFWGTGTHISRPDACTNWPGLNHMGATLTLVRKHLD